MPNNKAPALTNEITLAVGQAAGYNSTYVDALRSELTAARARIEDLDLTVSMLKGYIKIAADKLHAGEKPSEVAGFLNFVLGEKP
jgi:hypothetical protein